MRVHSGVYIKDIVSPLDFVSWCGLAVKRLAGKQKDLGSIGGRQKEKERERDRERESGQNSLRVCEIYNLDLLPKRLNGILTLFTRKIMKARLWGGFKGVIYFPWIFSQCGV